LLTLHSNTKYLIAMTVTVILVTGALTLPLTFDEQSADAKKRSQRKLLERQRKLLLKLEAATVASPKMAEQVLAATVDLGPAASVVRLASK
jgi:hypothetical protein